MNLAEFFSAIAPLFDGRSTAAEVAVNLYGPTPTRDSERLQIYEDVCRWRRGETLGWVLPRCKSWVLKSRGERVWLTIATKYFLVDPWRNLKAHANTAKFPAFLAAHGSEFGVPLWVAQLADFEWWLSSTRAAVDDPSDPKAGPLRLGSTVEVRPYDYDLVKHIVDPGWLDSAPPAQKPSAILIWRNLDQASTFETVGGKKIRLLGAIQKGRTIDVGLAEELGLTVEDMRVILRSSWRRGVLLGDLQGHRDLPPLESAGTHARDED